MTINFTPHLAPMSRGELCTCYVKLAGKATASDLRGALAKTYASEPFVHLVGEGVIPGEGEFFVAADAAAGNHGRMGVYMDDPVHGLDATGSLPDLRVSPQIAVGDSLAADSTGPTITLLEPGGSPVVAARPIPVRSLMTVVVSDPHGINASGTDPFFALAYRVDDGDWVDLTQDFRVDAGGFTTGRAEFELAASVGPGVHTLHVRAADNLNNRSEAAFELADSVTIDAHKQLYVPMGAGMVLFKDPATLSSIEHHAAYIIRRGSRDLGSRTLEGSRPGMAMLVHAGLSIIGRKGYELLIDQGIERARRFARRIDAHPDFELVSEPELNILTYRYIPAWVQKALVQAPAERSARINELLDKIIEAIQKRQREAGKTFVSRTSLAPGRYKGDTITVFRVVMANPLTTEEILAAVLDEQCEIAAQADIQAVLEQIKDLVR